MLKLLSCAQGHFWEKSAEDGADESPTLCPVCGQSAEIMPLLDLAPSETETAQKIATGSPPSPQPLRDKDGRPIVAGYEILSEFGKTPTGVRVYRARQVLVNRIVILKVVLAREDPGQLAWGSLRGEATALGRFAHPNIVPILEAGERERQLFFNAIEYVDGPTLAEVLPGKRLPVRQALVLIETLARAVHHAHEKNILHRNLKPGSILLQKVEDGGRKDEKSRMSFGFAILLHKESFIPKITDFGLARRPVEGDAGDVDLQGELPCYLAPEQAWGRAKEIGPATDVYALGAILYELLSGQPPFREATAAETIDALQTREPQPFSRFRVRVPPDVEAICRKCLDKQPRRRYPSALALAEDLRRWANGYPVQARTVGTAARLGKLLRRNARGVVLVLLGFMMGVTLFALLPSVAPPPTQRYRVREQNYRQSIARLEASSQQQIAQLEAELEKVQSNDNYLRYLLLARRALEAGDKAQAQKMLERCPELRHWEWDYLNGQLQGKNRIVELHAELPIHCMILSDDYLIAGGGKEPADDFRSEKGEVSVWDIQTGKRLWHWELAAPVRSLAFCNVGLALVSSSRHLGRFGCLQVRSLRVHPSKFSGELLFPSYQFKDRKPASVIEGPYIPHLLVTTDDGMLHQIQADTGQLQMTQKVMSRQLTPRGLYGRLRQIDTELFCLIRPDGKQIVLLPELNGHKSPLELPGGEGTTFLDLDYNSQSKLLAAAALDGTVRIWNVQSPDSEPTILRGHRGGVRGVSFDKAGQRLASCGKDSRVRIWDVKQGKELLSFEGYPSASRVILESQLGFFAFPDPQGRDWQASGRLAIAHGNDVTVILPPPRKGLPFKH